MALPSYKPDHFSGNAQDIGRYLEIQFARFAEAMRSDNKVIEVSVSHNEPVKPRDGMIAYADGTNWDPGSGEGFYAYYGGAWNAL